MKLALRILSLLLLLSGTLTQDEFNLGDALGDPDPTPAQPREQPKAPETDKSGGELDLFDALGPDVPPTKKPKKPSSGDSGGFDGFDLEDALKPDPKTDKPPVKPPKSGGGGGSFDDSDLFDVSGGDYKPDGGRSGGRASDPGHDPHGPADQPQDPDLLWDQILKMLNANTPEEFYVWISNLKQMLSPLLERAMELLQALP